MIAITNTAMELELVTSRLVRRCVMYICVECAWKFACSRHQPTWLRRKTLKLCSIVLNQLYRTDITAALISNHDFMATSSATNSHIRGYSSHWNFKRTFLVAAIDNLTLRTPCTTTVLSHIRSVLETGM